MYQRVDPSFSAKEIRVQQKGADHPQLQRRFLRHLMHTRSLSGDMRIQVCNSQGSSWPLRWYRTHVLFLGSLMPQGPLLLYEIALPVFGPNVFVEIHEA